LEQSNQGSNREVQVIDVDVEWVHLLQQAKRAGIQAEEIRRFFHDRTVQAVQ